VTGDAFTYQKLSSYSAWNGLNNASVTVANQDEKNYGYHLYGYNSATDELTFVKANVKSNDTASVNKTNAVVLKFNKKGFNQKTYIKQDSNNSFRAIDSTVVNSSAQMIDQAKVFFNLQKYDYEAKITTSDDNESIPWYTDKQNPINNDNYGQDNAFGLVISLL
jgi:prolyl oligopeptidase PreP (S9A serine peptidase family)